MTEIKPGKYHTRSGEIAEVLRALEPEEVARHIPGYSWLVSTTDGQLSFMEDGRENHLAESIHDLIRRIEE